MVLRLRAAVCGVAMVCVVYSCCGMAKSRIDNVRTSIAETRHVAKKAEGFADQTTQKDKEQRGSSIVGAASMYNPFEHGAYEGGIETASGESYDAAAWTAAIQTRFRQKFGGIRYGSEYQPKYALIEAVGKRAIVKINDVGPLRPGRVIDLNQKTMEYFDPSLQKGVIRSVRITPLHGDEWRPGPVNG